jgi:hypothetical protein
LRLAGSFLSWEIIDHPYLLAATTAALLERALKGLGSRLIGSLGSFSYMFVQCRYR